ncbi:hypothetical protein N7462_002167 [Penicillium macrosclerotiorum]|uniref:uncharacterized protein n=1 Tax=Penicillium macrosclerotiorum TaxID=303699 RepID=UPI00254954F1|nr:uncharacterized protein N7462_002167 [Penicillium macrosclerotiorum]KAJ5692744.1 hypothetical protein N7462_002167 [Penicillium macrosclerotiorum]
MRHRLMVTSDSLLVIELKSFTELTTRMSGGLGGSMAEKANFLLSPMEMVTSSRCYLGPGDHAGGETTPIRQ